MRRATLSPAAARMSREAVWRSPPRKGAPRRRLTFLALISLSLSGLASLAWFVRRVALCPLPDARAAPPPEPFAPYTRAASGDGAALIDFVWVSAFPVSLLTSIRSVCHFFDTSGAGTFHVIVPDDMAAYFERVVPLLQCAPTGAGGAARPPVRFAVWRESAVVPHFTRAAPHRGTVRQMVLKLAAALIVQTPFYLVLDSDVFARVPFNVSTLLPSDGPSGERRAATALDDPAFPQARSWHAEAARALRTPLVEATTEYCSSKGSSGTGGAVGIEEGGTAAPAMRGVGAAAVGGGPQGSGHHPPLSLASTQRPFALTSVNGGSTTVYGACRQGLPLVTHVTPMILSAELVQHVLIPRLSGGVGGSGGGGGDKGVGARGGDGVVGGGTDHMAWVDTLLEYHASRVAACPTAAWLGRFYTWTEYGLYFVSAVAAGALDDFHTFAEARGQEGGIVSLRHSAMLPEVYDRTDWGAVFDDGSDARPFFIIHSWFGRPLDPIQEALGVRMGGGGGAGAWVLPAAPSPHAAYSDHDAKGGS